MNNNNSSKQILLSVLGVAILVVAVVGVSFAAFTFTGAGTQENKITTGTVSMSYSEDTNGIAITNAFPTTDAQGMIQTGDAKVFDFTVGADITGTTTINYAVSAVAVDGNTLDQKYAKLYLEELDAQSGTKLDVAMAPKTFKTDALDDTTGKPASEMTLTSGTFTATSDKYYRLRMWLDESYQPGNTSQTFAVKVNVHAKAAAQ